MTESTKNKRKKKAERREAKADRKAKNKKVEKRSQPNNLLMAILIFGTIACIFAGVEIYKFMQKDATLAAYIKDNGGTEAYSNMPIDENSYATVKADKNHLDISINVKPADKKAKAMDIAKKTYGSEDGEETIKDIAAYFLTSMKSQTRAVFADVDIKVYAGKKEYKKLNMTCFEADRYLLEKAKETEKEAAKEEKEK